MWVSTTCNRIIAKKEETAKHETHLRQLATIKHSIDNASPRRFPHLKYKLKTKELQRDRANEIHLENRILLQKMLNIDTRAAEQERARNDRGRSLHAGYQTRELDRITRANHQLLTRLEKTTAGVKTAHKFNDDEGKRKKLVERMNENSNRWRRDLQLRVPLKQRSLTARGERDDLDERFEEFRQTYKKQMQDHIFPE